MPKWIENLMRFIANEPNLIALFGSRRMSQERIALRRRQNSFFFWLLPLSFLYLEVVFHFSLYGEMPIKTLIYFLLFSFAAAFFWEAVALLLPLRFNRVLTGAVLSVTCLLFSSQYVYYRFFKTFYRVSTMGMAGAAVRDFWRETISIIGSSWLGILLLLLPAVFYFRRMRSYAPSFSPTMSFRLYLLIFSILLQLLGMGIVVLDRSDFGDRHYYKNEFSVTETVKRFGVLTDFRLDTKMMLFGEPTAEIEGGDGAAVDPFAKAPAATDEVPAPEETAETPEPEIPVEYGDNVMDIDFAALAENEQNKDIQAAHEYFGALTPTKKNKYTGMFKGKNLIFLTLEGFSYKAVDKDRTPTLYKMMHEGFVFNNFYTSLWGGSTATGEYTATTGLFHNSAKCLEMSAKDLMPFTMGNQLKKLGYPTTAYHNHYYTYYGRDGSHPNFGYEFIGIGNGLEELAEKNGPEGGMTSCWPRSDYEMAVATAPEFINGQKPFHVYYMTVSGHANYNFGGNNMAAWHRDIVEDLPYSDGVKAYLACQYEVELMLAELVRQLSDAGILEDTVFVMSADHYPYALADSELAELYGLPVDGIHKNPDLLRNGWILWSASMKEPVIVDTPCSSLDIIPTISNLFGLEYDSRLLMGTDVLSDTMPLVILNQDGDGSAWNWINAYGVYNSGTRVFTPADGFSASEEEIDAYVKAQNRIVSQKNKYAHLILEKDYYRYVFGN